MPVQLPTQFHECVLDIVKTTPVYPLPVDHLHMAHSTRTAEARRTKLLCAAETMQITVAIGAGARDRKFRQRGRAGFGAHYAANAWVSRSRSSGFKAPTLARASSTSRHILQGSGPSGCRFDAVPHQLMFCIDSRKAR